LGGQLIPASADVVLDACFAAAYLPQFLRKHQIQVITRMRSSTIGSRLVPSAAPQARHWERIRTVKVFYRQVFTHRMLNVLNFSTPNLLHDRTAHNRI
jgi:hypothetical protein